MNVGQGDYLVFFYFYECNYYLHWREYRNVGTCLQVEATAAGVVEVACLHASVLERQHAESRRPHYTGHEHSPALYESPWQPHTRSVYAHMMFIFMYLTLL